jgi:hypothetical protein
MANSLQPYPPHSKATPVPIPPEMGMREITTVEFKTDFSRQETNHILAQVQEMP